MKSYVLRLSSHESNDVFAGNSNRRFHIKLQEPLAWANWEVALSSICLPTKIDLQKTLVSSNLLTPENFFIQVNGKRVTLDDLQTLTSDGLVAHLNAKLFAAYAISPASFADLDESGKPPISFFMDDEHIWIHTDGAPLDVQVSGLFAQLVRGTSWPSASTVTAAACASPNDTVHVPLEAFKNTFFGQLELQQLQPHLIFLYCDFIKPLMLGSTFGQLLQMVPYNHESRSGVMKYEVEHLDFIPLSTNDASTLQFELRNAAGDYIYFENPQQEILMTLVFRERNM